MSHSESAYDIDERHDYLQGQIAAIQYCLPQFVFLLASEEKVGPRDFTFLMDTLQATISRNLDAAPESFLDGFQFTVKKMKDGFVTVAEP